MASQAQLEADIALARAQVASLELQLDAAAGSPQPDPAVIADIERQLATARNTLIQLQNELNNLLVASDTNTNVGVDAQLPVAQQTIRRETYRKDLHRTGSGHAGRRARQHYHPHCRTSRRRR